MPEPGPIYFLILAIVGLIGAGWTAARVRAGKSGSAALPLAFLAFAGLGLSVYIGASEAVRNGLIAALVAFLIADLILKAAKKKQ